MDGINAFERLQMLVDFIRTFPTREQLVVFMSENICPQGELAGVNTAYLDDDGVIHIQFHHGFNLKNSPRTTINITEDNPGAECLRSILAFWELINGNTSIKHIPPLQMQNRELTSRQARILELIKEDRTNASIATILGYSESLIRQETIIIYKKLGVDGRRELKKTVAS